MAEKVNSATVYKDRFVKYQETYVDSIPEPPAPVAAPANNVAGSQKSVLARSARYNDKNSTQSVGGSNAKK